MGAILFIDESIAILWSLVELRLDMEMGEVSASNKVGVNFYYCIAGPCLGMGWSLAPKIPSLSGFEGLCTYIRRGVLIRSKAS